MDIRALTIDDAQAFLDVLGIAYLDDADDSVHERFIVLTEWDRAFGAFDGEELVGTTSAYSLDLTVPGARTVPMGGTTMVAVKPTHRRRGVLRALMAAHLDQVRERQEPLAGLWASEAQIYGRFGYGWATDLAMVEIDTRGLTITGEIDPSISVRMATGETIEKVAPSLYEQVRLREPGAISRSDDWWRLRRLIDEPSHRDGASAYRHAIAWRDDEPVGYVNYRTKDVFQDGISTGEVKVAEHLGVDIDAELALWRFLFGIDLTTKVVARLRGIHDPLLFRLDDSRRYVQKLGDGLYIRIMDVPVALASRTFSAAGNVMLGIVDQEIAGTYRLAVDDEGRATCELVEAPADVSMDAKTLGALSLGGRRVETLARAGRVHGSADALRLADRMFLGDRIPWIRDVF